MRLPWEVNPIFQRWLDQHFPDRAARVMARIREMRGGRDYDASFDTRMRGEGIWAELIAQRLAKAKQRFGLDRERRALDLSQFTQAARRQRGRRRATCSASAAALAQSATSGSKNSHCTCGNAARKRCSTRLIAATSAGADVDRPHLRLDRHHHVAAELLRQHLVDRLDLGVVGQMRAHPLEHARLDALADQQGLDLDADEHGDQDQQHADADRAGRVPRRVAGRQRQADEGEGERQAAEGGDVFGEDDQQLALARLAKPAPQALPAAVLVDLAQAAPERDAFGGDAEDEDARSPPRRC